MRPWNFMRHCLMILSNFSILRARDELMQVCGDHLWESRGANKIAVINYLFQGAVHVII
jgi:hypothetical protein